MNILLTRLSVPADKIQPQLGLGYLATAIRKKHNVEILDCLKEKIEDWELIRYIKEKNFDVIGLQFYTMHYPKIKAFSEKVKKIRPQAKLIVGGPHPSARPKETMEEIAAIDFAFKGEAEVALPILLELIAKNKLNKKNLKKVPGLVWRKTNKQVEVNPQQFVEELDCLGFPAWDLLKPTEYPRLQPHGFFTRQFPTAPIITTRGCPYQCTYCGGHLVSGRKIRSRSPQNVIKEIGLLHKKYGIKEIHIEDDNFTFHKKFVELFCKKLIKNNWGISWCCPNGVRIDTLDRELLLLMKKSGFYAVSVGIENGNDRILKAIKKSITVEKIREKIQLIHSVGLHVHGFLMLGFPTETREEIKRTMDFAIELKLDRVSFSCLQPLPNTEVYNDLIKKGEIKNPDWGNFFYFKANYSPTGIPLKELENLRKKYLRKFYFRPIFFLRSLIEIRSFYQLKSILKRGINWLQ